MWQSENIQDPLMQGDAAGVAEQTSATSESLLERPARQLAENHSVTTGGPGTRVLLEHLQQWETTLRAAHTRFRSTAATDRAFTSAREWLLDNFYIVEQTVRQIREDLTPSYLKQLPKLNTTALAGYPRVFALAWELVAYTQCQLDLALVAHVVQRYQDVTPLGIGELWALPIMLRLGILERLASAIANTTGLEVPPSLKAVPILPLSQTLPDEAIVANCSASLRLLTAQDWKAFFEEVSVVEHILQRDPAGAYGNMDFDSRDRYRRVIEELARDAHHSEDSVALRAVELAQTAHGLIPQSSDVSPTIDRTTHIGFYLIDAGRARLEALVGSRPGWSRRWGRWCLAHPTTVFLGGIGLLSLLLDSLLIWYAQGLHASPIQVVVIGLLGSAPAMATAIGIIHLVITYTVPPSTLPRMDFSQGIPAHCRTMVIIPTLIGSLADIDSLADDLELQFLRNHDPHLTFALLTDFVDAPAQRMPGDEEMLAYARKRIEALNTKYPQEAAFYLFHRERQWNPREGVWMGWERKRGKLTELNALLLHGKHTAFSVEVGDLSVLSSVRYVITLDADSALPLGGASRLVATLAHPLNHAVFAPDGASVTAGYTVLQPRIEILPTSATRSRFAKIFAGSAGLDLYTLAVSDVYQDLFGEGSYCGKGIYDVAAFERSLAGRIPENTLLSHDLFEGMCGRAALVSDVILYEEYPAQYLAFARRMHRWIRGDWQLLPYLLPRIRGESATVRNPLSTINRWRACDNLRRSLLAPLLLTLLATAWLGLPGSALGWSCLVLFTTAIPIATQGIVHASRKIGQRPARRVLQPAADQIVRWAFSSVVLPYEAILALRAIGTALVRVFITHRHLLQWTPAAATARAFGAHRGLEVWRRMSVSLLFVSVLALATALTNPQIMPVALPLIGIWLAAPAIVSWMSRPIVRAPQQISQGQRDQLRRVARRTWAFFEWHVGPDDHWLPPDHFQEAPRGIVAHHTSPTNIGMLLLATISAFDLGYVGLSELAIRVRSTFETLDKLERYRGHFLNWYDTRSLEPIVPRYVSTVDSGNLAAALIALQECCATVANGSLGVELQWQGLLDILGILTDILGELEVSKPETSIAAVERELENIRTHVAAAKEEPKQWSAALAQLSTQGWEALSHHVMTLLETHGPHFSSELIGELRLYLDRLRHHMSGMRQDIDVLMPWLGHFASPPALFMAADGPLQEAWQAVQSSVPVGIPRVCDAVEVYDTVAGKVAQLEARVEARVTASPAEHTAEALTWCQQLVHDLMSARLTVQNLLRDYDGLAKQADKHVADMDYRFLFDSQRLVFHIGYNVTTEKLDVNYYDLLASEARIASLIAIAKGDAPVSHWLHLGRPVTAIKGEQVLLSWSGTMFEYLMPTLLLRQYPGTLLEHSCRGAVHAQQGFGQQHRMPWGASESGYYAFDVHMNYQYRAFGVPDLAFKRNLAADLVIAPYASVLALPFEPLAVLRNLTRLTELRLVGPYGLFEAVDFTPERLPSNQAYAVVKSYMAHHQGMILVALDNFLLDDIMVNRVHRNVRIHSVALLLQEKMPQDAPIEYPQHEERAADELPAAPRISLVPWRVLADDPVPQVHLLAQGRYSLFITSAGGGYSQWQDTALTRWQADSTLDSWGSWIYVHDRDSGAVWSASYQPTGTLPDKQEVLFHPHKVEFRRWDRGIYVQMEVTVGSEEIEMRRLTLLNESDEMRRLTLCSYAEIVLATQASDQRHPAFNKLFIESEYVPEVNALLFHRRRRAAQERPLFLLHGVSVHGEHAPTRAYETDRARFVGRGGTTRAPGALASNGCHLSNSAGVTLDPIMSLAQHIDLAPHSKAEVTYVTLATESHAQAVALAKRYHSPHVVARAFDEAQARCETELAQLGLNSAGVEHIQQLLSALMYPTAALRASPETLTRNVMGQDGLWAYGISGDYPILLVRVHDAESTVLWDCLQAYMYWRNRHLTTNLVVLNCQDSGYAQDLHDHILKQIGRVGADARLNQRDGIFVVHADQLREPSLVLLETVARAIVDDTLGSLAQQLARASQQPARLPEFVPTLSGATDPEPTPMLDRPSQLIMDNGVGGFSEDGDEYVVYLPPGQRTPHPWINVIANPRCGFLVSEAGSSCTWAENSGENRLTPWNNDPVCDIPGEALYVRDEETAGVWSPTPLPAGAGAPYVVRHGAGYSIFEHFSHGLKQQVRMFAAPDAPVKIVQLRLENLWTRPRRLTVTYYAEWVLGTSRHATQGFIVPEYEPDCHALLASNRYSAEFGEQVAFLAANKNLHGLTTDRAEFLGRMGTIRRPAALERIGLASTVRAGVDPCAALQLHVDLLPGQAEQVYFLLGAGSSREETLAVIRQFQDPTQVETAWRSNAELWNDVLNRIRVATPDRAMDIMLNRWLLYQTLSCRIWGRSALYQSSGAFGYRDQLQDILALLHARPDLAREHILRAAAHQFEAGDVLHWWHPPSGRGVRTRVSDDLLWLPFVTAHYVRTTGDTTILREDVPFRRGELLKQDEDERYGNYAVMSERYSLFEHCRRAIEKGATQGAHGLPLMGAGDWNDGMNRVGSKGRGESVWLGWFLYAVLTEFGSLCDLIHEDPTPYRARAQGLADALQTHAWDGQWYRRAYYDDGWPLGSAQNRECQIDSIAQSWAVLSRAGAREQAMQAMDAVDAHLVKRADQLILLLTPPFDRTAQDPGYIKGYAPGVRENGGQYTHAATWVVWAFAALGEGERAHELYRMLNPICHSDSPEKVSQYQVEPYVVAADIYSVLPHTGKGGWTWYTGSSGWMYRVGIEALLGVRRRGDALEIDPCIPPHWPGFELTYHVGATTFHIVVENRQLVSTGVRCITLDGNLLAGGRIPLTVDGARHEVVVSMGPTLGRHLP